MTAVAAELVDLAKHRPAEWRVHHELPNRTRFRLEAPAPRRASPAAVAHALRAVPGIERVEFTPETGSLLVHHDGTEATRREVRRAVAALRLETLSAPPGGPAASSQGDAVRTAVLSLLSAALPPAPRAALELVRTLRTAR